MKQSSSSIIILRGLPLGVDTTNIDGGVYPATLLVVGTGNRRDFSANVYKQEAFKAFSCWFTFSKIVSPRETEYLLAISTLDCVSLIYLAIDTLRNSIVVGEDATNGTGCAIGVAAVVVITDAGDGEKITDRNTLTGIGVASQISAASEIESYRPSENIRVP